MRVQNLTHPQFSNQLSQNRNMSIKCKYTVGSAEAFQNVLDIKKEILYTLVPLWGSS